MEHQKILLIGPFPKPISGVSLANKVVKEILDKQPKFKVNIINTSLPFFNEKVGSFSLRKLMFFLKINISVLKVFSNNVIYMTPGQTFFGITKYTLFILLSSILNKETIIHVHGNHLGKEYDSLKGVKKKFFYYLISKFNKGIVLSASLQKNLTPFLNEKKIFELPNFAENYLYENLRKKDFSNLKIIFLSNLMKEKGIIVLLEALKQLEKENIYYEAKIAGNIDEETKEEVTKLLNQLKNTTYLGVVRGKEKRKLLHWSTVFVLPTFYKMEGQPISILEAMATKNVIVTTKHAGILDVVEDNKNGFFVQKNDIESLVKKLIYISKNKRELQNIGEYNSLYFQKSFTLKKFERKLVTILNS